MATIGGETGVTDPAKLNVSDLIDHIVARYHDAHRRELPELVALAEKVERVHHDAAAAPLGLAAALSRLSAELDMHMNKEEQVLFPAMRHGVTETIARPIAVMRHEHDGHGEIVAEIGRLTNNCKVPEGACGSWQRLYAGVGKLCNDLASHMAAENDVLFPRFELAAKGGCICAHK